MVTIAVCQTSESDRKKIALCIDEYASMRQRKIKTELFSSSEKLLKKIDEGYSYDILLLDVLLSKKGLSGIELARILKNRSSESEIAFITSSKDHALEAFDVEAIGYLLKPLDSRKLFRLIDRCLIYRKPPKRREVIIKDDRRFISIKAEDISFVDVQKRCPVYHRLDNSFETGKSMRLPFTKTVEDLIKTGYFCNAGPSLLVNMSQVSHIDGKNIYLKNGEELNTSQNAMPDFKRAYESFLKAFVPG